MANSENVFFWVRIAERYMTFAFDEKEWQIFFAIELGTPFQNWPGLTLVTGHPTDKYKKPDIYDFQGMFMCSEACKSFFEELSIANLQFLECHYNEVRYYILNPLRKYDILDFEASKYTTVNGEPCHLYSPFLRDDVAVKDDIFLIEPFSRSYVFSSRVKKEFERRGFKGLKFTPLKKAELA